MAAQSPPMESIAKISRIDYLGVTQGFLVRQGWVTGELGMTQSILSKTGMGYRGTRDDLVRAHGCAHGIY